MIKDSQGLEVTASSEEEVSSINHFNHELISNGKHAGDILVAAENHPGCFLIQCLAAGLNLFFQEPENYQQANQFLLKAKNANQSPNEREQLYFKALLAWHALDYSQAIRHFVNVTQQYPRDCAAAKFAEWLFYCTGQKYQGKNFLAMCEPMYPYNKKNNYFLSSYAFALELSGHFEEALRIGSEALEIDKDTAWAHHAVSHVQLLNGDIEGSIKFLEEHKASWQMVAPPLSAHNHWHLGLLYIANCEFDKAEQIFRKNIWLNFPETNWQLIESTSIMWRMEMAGKRQDKEWKQIASHLGNHPIYHDVPFQNMHFFYALARNNRIYEAEEAIKKISSDIQFLPASFQHTWRDIGIPLLKGVIAFANEDFANAVNYLSTAINDIYTIGGSDAQCEIAIQTYYLSLLKSGDRQQANILYQKYLSHYDGTNLAKYWQSI